MVPEDFNAYRKLKRPTAKGIFGYLHLWFHASQGREVAKDYSELCILLNVPSYEHVSKIKETMGRSLDELISIGYLGKWDIKLMATKVGYKLVLNAGDELLRVLAATHRKQLAKDSDIESQKSDASQDRATGLLIERGVTAVKAKELARSHGETAVAAAIQYTDSLLSGRTRRKLENPAGFIVYLLENGITVPIQQKKSEGAWEDSTHSVNLQARYEEFVNSYIDNAIKVRYPGESLTKRLHELVEEHSGDPVFKTLTPNVQTILAERILRGEVATELNLPKFEDWNRQEQPMMF